MTQYTIGNSIIEVDWNVGKSASQLLSMKFAANDPNFTASAMAIRLQEINGGSTVRLGIYADNTGSPGSLMGETGDFTWTGPASSWYTASLKTPVAIVNGQDYWLAIHSPNTLDINSTSAILDVRTLSSIPYNPTGLPASQGPSTRLTGATIAIYATGTGPGPTAYAINGATTSLQPYRQIWRSYRVGHNHAQRELQSGNWQIELTFEPADIDYTREWTEAASSGSLNLNVLRQYRTDWTTLSGIHMDVTQEPETTAGHAGEMIIVVRSASIRA